MAKRVLLIESDTAHAREIYKALEAHGVEVRVTGDGKEGLELAQEERPDAIVLCVELPRVSGWSVCQKLKKDAALKDIAVVLTSSESTLETFDQHRRLKGRAEEYLLKPFPMQALVEKLAPIVGFDPAAPAAPAHAEQELVSLDDVEFEPTGATALDGANPLAGGDDDLKFLDDAFERLEGAAPPEAEAEAEVEVGLELPPEGTPGEAALGPEAPLDGQSGLEVSLELAPDPSPGPEPEPAAEAAPLAAALDPLPAPTSGEARDAEVARLTRALEDSEAARRELEARLARAEERVLRAVARLRHDDEARERARKALAIAQQLLGAEASQAPAAEEPTPAASASGSTPR
ncbi:response regulator transcription factor [Anaeromyxobacter paludicola]|uniref:Response regulatory domain-containing protein n=1 Tax=Anaeromyxobacter paludicola TaxID=2918171 RepID=A0ABN6N603_9BACT|nr:response regulator [Anaeromyxobacter paludicola]BDG07243.1 hypothetical protein AMPC_03560 [Anaeromyxobacter paludicola]